MPKRKASEPLSNDHVKAVRVNGCDVEDKEHDWPAPLDALERARDFLKSCVEPEPKRVVLVPDKDADGLSATLIAYRTLVALGLPASNISLHFLPKGSNIHLPEEKRKMEETDAERVIVLDQGSRPGPSLVDGEGKECLVIDHHFSHQWPDRATVLTACHSPPIATTSLLTYCLCTSLLPSLKDELGWIALIGVYGDLGPSEVTFGSGGWGCPELANVEKEYKKKTINDAVSLLNAPRRSPDFNVPLAWTALLSAKSPSDIAGSSLLWNERQKVNAEVKRCQFAAPKFSRDGRVAMVTIESKAQVHPVIATRWAGTLKSAKKLVCVICANEGYTEGRSHFSTRINSALRKLPDGERPDLIALLKEYGKRADEIAPGWLDRVGDDFARGHKEATGGIIANEEFEVLVRAMEIGVKDETALESPTKKKKAIDPGQKTTLDGFFLKVQGAK